MTTGYPGALDDLDEGTRPGLTHGDVADSVEAIQATLGVNPQGASADVAARLAAIEAAGGEIPEGNMRYRGAWDSGTAYVKGDVVTTDLGTFVAIVDAPSAPALPADDWSETFTGQPDRANLNWDVEHADWAVVGGKARVNNNYGGGNNLTKLALRNLGTDGAFTVYGLDAQGLQSGTRFGVVFRHVDASNYWLVRRTTSGTQLGVYKVAAGSESLVGATVAAPAGTKHDVTVTVSGTSVTVNWGGTVIARTIDAAVPTATRWGVDGRADDYLDTYFDGAEFTPANTSGWGVIERLHTHDNRYYTESEADARFVRTVNGVAPDGSGNVADRQAHTFPPRPGTLAGEVGTHRLYNDTGRTLTITKVRASVGTAPTGAAVVVDVHKNGTTIFTTQSARPSIAAGANTATGTPAVTSWADGEYLTVDIDQVGSTTPGADLTVTVIA